MHQILIYGDSLSWGIIPDTRQRLPFAQRWPGIMEQHLLRPDKDVNQREKDLPALRVRVIEDCLNGRRTVWHDPFKAGRCGATGIEQRIEVNSPLSLVVLFLGCNDFQVMHNGSAWQTAQGLAALVTAIRHAPIEPGMPIPPVLLVAPPALREAKGSIAPKFAAAHHRAFGLTEAIKQAAQDIGCEFFDAGKVTLTSEVDGVHLDQGQHQLLGVAMAHKVRSLLSIPSRG